jgi:hypothetical protein
LPASYSTPTHHLLSVDLCAASLLHMDPVRRLQLKLPPSTRVAGVPDAPDRFSPLVDWKRNLPQVPLFSSWGYCQGAATARRGRRGPPKGRFMGAYPAVYAGTCSRHPATPLPCLLLFGWTPATSAGVTRNHMLVQDHWESLGALVATGTQSGYTSGHRPWPFRATATALIRFDDP